MFSDLTLVLAGLALLVAGGESMVRGASALAARLGVAPLVIGLTVVSFGTSAPELAVNVSAAMSGDTDLSFGNIFGSNLANIGLIVACTALLRPLEIRNVVIAREVPMMGLATIVAVLLGLDAMLGDPPSRYGRGDGMVLLMLFTVFAYYTVRDVVLGRGDMNDGVATPAYSVGRAVFYTLAGIVGLVAGGELTVRGAVSLAEDMGVSQTIIGLTLVAVGTSLPELVASVIAALRGHVDLAIGNIVGSNIFNLLIVLGTTATIETIRVPEGGGSDLAMVVLLSGLLWFTARSNGRRIIRTEATLLLGCYLGYVVTRVLM